MKQHFFLLILPIFFLVLGESSFGQAGFGIGAKGGLNISSLSYDPDLYFNTSEINQSRSSEFVAGFVVDIPLSNLFAFQFEPRYIQKANNWEANKGGGKEKVTLQEFELPILIRFDLLKGQFNPFVCLGPNIGVLLSARDHVEGVGPTYELNIKRDMAVFDFSLDGGVGVGFNAAKQFTLSIETRYSLGVSNLDNSEEDKRMIQSRGVQILFGILYRFLD